MKNKLPFLHRPIYTEEIAEIEREKSRKFQQQLINIDVEKQKIQQKTWDAQQMEDLIKKLNSES